MHGVTQREQLIPMSVYRRELAKARLGDNIANHMGFNVNLEGLGTFSLSLGFEDDKPTEMQGDDVGTEGKILINPVLRQT